MKINGWLFILFGALLIGGGTAGYIIAGSIPSIVCGTVLGITLCILGAKTLKESVVCENTALIVTLVVDLFFSYRLLKAKSFMPAGMMAIIASLIIIVACISIKKRLSKTLN